MTAWQWVGVFSSIILLDLVLSGDNALVLGAAAAQLPRRQRMYALLFGGAGAIILRIVLTSIASMIFNIPWLQTAGAIVLFVIALRLLAERSRPQVYEAQEQQTGGARKKPHSGQESFRAAALTILIADVTMSLDNILAVGAAANGAFLPIAVGLFISIAIILCGSALIAELMTCFTWLLDAAALVLAWTSGTMIRDDLYTTPFFKIYLSSWSPFVIPLASCLCMTFILFYFHLRDRANLSSQPFSPVPTLQPASQPVPHPQSATTPTSKPAPHSQPSTSP